MEEEMTEEQEITEEYKIWKKNSPFLYDCVITHALEWPSLTCQWLPDQIFPDDDQSTYSIQRLLLGTHTSDNEQNHLLFAEVKVPLTDAFHDLKPNEETQEFGGHGLASAKIEIVQMINVEAEINRARYMPQNPNVIACHTGMSDILVFDKSLHTSKPEKSNICEPNIRLHGHSKEGYGLSWNTLAQGQLVSGADDKLVLLFDIGKCQRAATRGSTTDLDYLVKFEGHSDVIEDVQFNPHNVNTILSCSDDKKVMIWDSRSPQNAVAQVEAHSAEVHSISVNPFLEYLMVSASADNTVALWDTRNLSQRLHTMEGHKDQVFSVQWSPFNECILASCSSDRRILTWDLSKIGAEQSAEDAEDGAPELLFIHSGHTEKISDFSWNNNDEWFVASVAENNILMVWQMAQMIYMDENNDERMVDDDELE